MSDAQRATSRASAFLRNIAETQGREPTSDEQNEAVRMRRSDAGLPPIDPAEVAGTLGTPFTTNETPSTSSFGANVQAKTQDGARIQSEQQAVRLAELLKQRAAAGEEIPPGAVGALRDWRKNNPPAAAPEPTPAEAFEQNMIATDRVSDSSAERSKRQKLSRSMGPLGDVTGSIDTALGRERVERAPDPDSRDAILAEQEKGGLDTTTGFGNFGQVFGLAKEFNSPRARVAYIDKIARAQLSEAGIELPEGVQPLQFNEDLQEMEYLRPTEDGKARWTLAEGEFFRPQDIAAIADLPQVGAAVGATVASMNPAGRHPAIREFAGDVVGRSVGTTLEALINMGEVTMEEYQTALKNGAVDSAIETAIGRTVARVGKNVFGRGIDAGNQDPDVIDANIKEAADVMEEVNELAGRDIDAGDTGLRVSRGEAADVTRELQREKGREKTLKKANAEALEEIRLENKQVLSEANDNLANRQGAAALRGDAIEVVERANRRVTEARAEFGGIEREIDAAITGVDGELEEITYFFKGDADTAAGPPGAIIQVNHADGTITLGELFAGGTFTRGETPLILDKILTDIAADTRLQGYRLLSDSDVSASAMKMMSRMEEQGFVFSNSPTEMLAEVAAGGGGRRGISPVVDGASGRLMKFVGDGPVFEILRVPGQMVTHPRTAEAAFDKMMLETELGGMMDVLPAAQKYADDANLTLRGVLKWSDQRQVSGYTVENKASNTLRQQVRRLQNRVEQSLTGADASEAGRVLANTIRREVDEEGNDILAGLASEQLDLGNLVTARETLARMAKESGDPEMARTVETIDTLLQNGTIWTDKGNPIAQSTRANINSAVRQARVAQEHVDTAQASINANILFKQNNAGEFVNTNMQQMRGLMGNEARFMQHMKPVLDENPTVRNVARDALHQIYREDVMATGWTRAKHNTWIKRYRNSMNSVMSKEEAELISLMPLQSGKDGLWRATVEGAQRRHAQVLSRFDLEPMRLNPQNILKSLNDMSAKRRDQAMRELAEMDPQLHTGVKRQMAEEVRQTLNSKFFDTSAGTSTLGTGKQLNEWFQTNKDTLRAVQGNQYVTDLESVVRAHVIDDRRRRVRGVAPETQGDIIRVTRSLLGPLSRPQRQITAGNYVRQRMMAKKILEVYSDPDALRVLKTGRGISPRSEQGMRIMGRLGLWEALGIKSDDSGIPQDKNEVEEFYRWVDEQARRGLEDQE